MVRRKDDQMEARRGKRDVGEASWKNIYAMMNGGLKIKILLIAILIVIFICAVAFGVSVNFTASSRTTNFGLENIGELATQAGFFTNVQVIEDDVDVFGVHVPLTTSKYVFSYDGTVKAGINFEDVRYSVNELCKKVKITLPEIRIFSVDVDENSLEIYDERQSIFTPLSIEDVQASRIALEEEVRNQAIANDILKEAENNAKLLIQGFLSASFDPEVYTFEFE